MVGIRDDEIEVTFFRASGPGGQHRNTRETGVRIRHLPTGIVVTATERRSQAENRRVALERLARALEERTRKPRRRVPTRPGRAARERRLRAKRLRAQKKRLRGRVSPEGD